MRLHRITATGSWICLVAALVSAPVALASTRPVLGLPAFWPVAVGLALAAGAFSALGFSGPARLRVPWAAAACIAGLAALAIVQSVPLPRGVVEKIAPARAAEDL